MSTVQVPEDFLRGPALHATLRQLDFAKTDPPIPAFKDSFAAIVDNVLTETECKELLRLAEESTQAKHPDSTFSPRKWERAMINAGNGRQIESIDSRKSGRIILDSSDLAQRLLDRLMPFMRECRLDTVTNMPRATGLGPARRGETLRLSRLNERLRFLRYGGGDYFRPHFDGCYVTPDGTEKSLFTIHLYLNGDGDQDMEELGLHIERAEKKRGGVREEGEIEVTGTEADELGILSALGSPHQGDTLLGGATSFLDGYSYKDSVRVFPKTGSVLIFQQRNLFHSGDDVFRGIKYTVRTDVMYVTEPAK